MLLATCAFLLYNIISVRMMQDDVLVPVPKLSKILLSLSRARATASFFKIITLLSIYSKNSSMMALIALWRHELTGDNGYKSWNLSRSIKDSTNLFWSTKWKLLFGRIKNVNFINTTRNSQKVTTVKWKQRDGTTVDVTCPIAVVSTIEYSLSSSTAI